MILKPILFAMLLDMLLGSVTLAKAPTIIFSYLTYWKLSLEISQSNLKLCTTLTAQKECQCVKWQIHPIQKFIMPF